MCIHCLARRNYTVFFILQNSFFLLKLKVHGDDLTALNCNENSNQSNRTITTTRCTVQTIENLNYKLYMWYNICRFAFNVRTFAIHVQNFNYQKSAFTFAHCHKLRFRIVLTFEAVMEHKYLR